MSNKNRIQAWQPWFKKHRNINAQAKEKLQAMFKEYYANAPFILESQLKLKAVKNTQLIPLDFTSLLTSDAVREPGSDLLCSSKYLYYAILSLCNF